MTAQTLIENIKKSNDSSEKNDRLLLCTDSDGCIMDSMTPKHKLCFGPLMIKEWHLEANEKEILSLWNEVNLYSSLRGVNRFKGLSVVLKIVNEKYAPIVEIGNLLHWTESSPLSEASLMQTIKENGDVTIFKKALAWSQAVNRATSELADGVIKPFENAVFALEYASRFADIAVISGAASDVLYDEWQRYGLTKYVKIFMTQDSGTKTQCIRELIKTGYITNNVIMCGDSMGDLDAAKNNNVFFYPVTVGAEVESWKNFPRSFDAFRNGNFNSFQKDLTEKFINNLNGGTNNG